MKLYLVEIVNNRRKHEFVEDILVFESLELARNYVDIRKVISRNKYYVLFEREVGTLNKKQEKQVKEFYVLDDFDFQYNSFASDKLIEKVF